MVSTMGRPGEFSLRDLNWPPWTADLLEVSSHLILYTAMSAD